MSAQVYSVDYLAILLTLYAELTMKELPELYSVIVSVDRWRLTSLSHSGSLKIVFSLPVLWFYK
jgi:hypothetical protein